MIALPTHLTTGGQIATSTSFTTASITPTKNNLVLVFMESARSTGSGDIVSVAGCSMTWTKVLSTQSASNTTRHIIVYRGLASSPSTGSLTMTAGNNLTALDWSVMQISNVKTTGTNGSDAIVQSATSDLNTTSTGITVNISSLSSQKNVVVGFVDWGGGTTVTKGSNFTLIDSRAAGMGWINTQYGFNQTAINWTWSSANNWAHAAAIELASSPAAGGGFLMNFV